MEPPSAIIKMCRCCNRLRNEWLLSDVIYFLLKNYHKSTSMIKWLCWGCDVVFELPRKNHLFFEVKKQVAISSVVCVCMTFSCWFPVLYIKKTLVELSHQGLKLLCFMALGDERNTPKIALESVNVVFV